MREELLRITDAGMTFGTTTVLSGVSLSVRASEVHALAGHNGSGKSTLVKILAGRHVPRPETSVSIGSEFLRFGHPEESAKLGLRFVHQTLSLVPALSVTENLALGVGYGTRLGRRIRWPREHKRAAHALAVLGYEVDPRQPVSELSPSTRSAVAIARALSDRMPTATRVLVLDEVTATMPGPEAKSLLALVERLKGTGVGILMVSHHLEELEEVADRVSVLRDGELVATVTNKREITVGNLTDLIVGSATTHVRPNLLNRLAESIDLHDDLSSDRDRCLSIRQMSGKTLDRVSFDARPGEIVGFAGVTGSGREEVAGLIHGSSIRTGEVYVDGVGLPSGRPDISIRRGVALLPSDRAHHAVLPGMSIRQNSTISRLGNLTGRLGYVRAGHERKEVHLWIDTLSVKGGNTETDVLDLSGGNQQKVMLARALRLEPRVLLLDEPTQGVDVGAVEDIYALINSMSPGTAIILCSSDLGELARCCSTVHILRSGKIATTLSGLDLTKDNLARYELAGLDAAAATERDRFAKGLA